MGSKRSGFTLVELVAAMAISVLLMVTVMGLAARLSIASKKVRESHPVNSWKTILQSRIESDYRGARAIVVRPTEILIDVVGSPIKDELDDSFLLPMPKRIRYSIRSNDQESWLIRSEQLLVGNAYRGQTNEWMANDVVGFRSDQVLATDVAPGVFGLEIELMNQAERLELTLVRHGAFE